MEIIHHSIQKSVRIWIHGNPKEASKVWIAMHGYGQDVERFAGVLSILEDENTAVVIPEGPHRFYTKGFSGDVGASWMTKSDREYDILDYLNYLDGIVEKFNLREKQISVLGFSQGAATASRWVAKSNVKIHSLVLWAGIIPPDLDISSDIPALQKISTTVVVGDQDEFINESSLFKMKELMDEYQLQYELITFSGTHRLNREILKTLKNSR